MTVCILKVMDHLPSHKANAKQCHYQHTVKKKKKTTNTCRPQIEFYAFNHWAISLEMRVRQTGSTFSTQLCDTALSSAVTECTVCRLAPCSIPFQLPALSTTNAGNPFKTSHKLSTVHCSNASVRFLHSQQNSLHSYGCSILGNLHRAPVQSFLNVVTDSIWKNNTFISSCFCCSQWKAFKRASRVWTVLHLNNMQDNKTQEAKLRVQCLPDLHSISRQFCRDISGMLQCIMHGQEYWRWHKKCLHMPLSAATIEPDAACFASRKLFKPEGVGVLGCGREGSGFQRAMGVAPDVCSAHLDMRAPQTSADLYPLPPAGPKQWGCSKPHVKLAHLVSQNDDVQTLLLGGSCSHLLAVHMIFIWRGFCLLTRLPGEPCLIELLMRKREQWGVICADSTFYIDIHSRRWSTTLRTIRRYQTTGADWRLNPRRKTLEAHECSTTVPLPAHSITWQLLAAGMYRNVTSLRVSPLRRVNGRIWVCGVTHTLGLCTHTWIFTSQKQFQPFYKRDIWQPARASWETQTRHPSK